MTDWKLPEAFDFDDRPVRYGVLGDGPPLVIVHGTPWSSFNMRHLIKALSSDYRVYYHDLIGYGQSDRSESDV
ncbi:MAG: pimeloyl-ACP methyl ester carboxylesterase [Planctomycetota bacterium]|jgi:pimeloyl-ACP methyl ester carboxylesterase